MGLGVRAYVVLVSALTYLSLSETFLNVGGGS